MSKEHSGSTAAGIRKGLLVDIERWQGELGGDGPLRGTLELGIAQRAIGEVEPLLRLAIEGLMPAAEIPGKATLGQLVELVERHGRQHRMDCLRLPRRLLARREVIRLNRFLRARNRVVHPDASPSNRAAPDPLTSHDIREVLDAARVVAELPLFDELQCRDAKRRTLRAR